MLKIRCLTGFEQCVELEVYIEVQEIKITYIEWSINRGRERAYYVHL